MTASCTGGAGSAPGVDTWARAQHERGRLTARERVELLLDTGSAKEPGTRGPAAGDVESDGVLAVLGTIGGRPVCVFAKDFSVHSGTLGEVHAQKIARLQEFALQSRVPVIGMYDTAGLRLESGSAALTGFGAIARNSAAATGVIPQISVVFGSCPGADALLAALSDFVFMVNDDSSLYVTGPDIVKAVTHEDVTASDLGGPGVHTKKSGLADAAFDNDVLAIRSLRRMFEYLPAHRDAEAPEWPTFDPSERETPALDTLLPRDTSCGYDVREVIGQVVDEGEYLELQAGFAANVVTAFSRLGGRTVGVVANQASVLAGVLDADAACKAARFVRFCDGFGIPVVSFVDVAGCLPGTAQEHGGVARHAAQLIAAYARARVPLLTVVLRKAYGAAGIAMASASIGADIVLGWMGAQVALIGPKGAAELVGRAATPSGESVPGEDLVDEFILPARTRQHLLDALAALSHKPRPSRPERS